MEQLIDCALYNLCPLFSMRLAEVQEKMGGFDKEGVPTEKLEEVTDKIEKYLLA